MNKTNLRRSFFLAVGLAVQLSSATAQGPDDPNEGVNVSYDAADSTWTFSWWGRMGRSYFIQHSEDLIHWSYWDVIEQGQDQVIGYEFTNTWERSYLRLKYLDEPASDPETADFDGDGLGNFVELLLGLDPFDPDTDDDLALDGDGDADGDNVINRYDYAPSDELIDWSTPGRPNYVVFPLGLPPGESDLSAVQVRGINAPGQVLVQGQAGLYVWFEGTWQTLARTAYIPANWWPLGCASLSQVQAQGVIGISDSGAIVGYGGPFGLYWSSATATPDVTPHFSFPVLPQGETLDGCSASSYIRGITANGIQFGTRSSSLDYQEGFESILQDSSLIWTGGGTELHEWVVGGKCNGDPGCPDCSVTLGSVPVHLAAASADGRVLGNYPDIYEYVDGQLEIDEEYAEHWFMTAPDGGVATDLPEMIANDMPWGIEVTPTNRTLIYGSYDTWILGPAGWGASIHLLPSRLSQSGLFYDSRGIWWDGRQRSFNDSGVSDEWEIPEGSNPLLKMNASGICAGMARRVVDPVTGEEIPELAQFDEPVLLLPVEVAVDGNRDGEVTFNGVDRVTNEKPYRFWVNSDKDAGDDAAAEDKNPNDTNIDPDSDNDTIDCLRDLEDFTQLVLNAGSLAELIESDAIEIGFRFTDVKAGTDPSIRVFYAHEQDGNAPDFDGAKYLTDETAAQAQMAHANSFARVDSGSQSLGIIPNTFFDGSFFPEIDSQNPFVRFIFEGISPGEGTLALVVKMSDGTETEAPLLRMELLEVTDMYEHWTVGDDIDFEISAIPDQASRTSDSGTYDPEGPEEDDCIVFVHGWRMLNWERRYFASTAFKRLWHQGYKGRFFHFSWPTEWTERRTGILWDYLGNPPEDADNYADSEERAYHSAEGLRAFLMDLRTQYGAHRVRMFAHSMGGIVASEAMHLHSKISGGGQLLRTYASCQAAMAAYAYDSSATPRTTSAFLNLLFYDTPESYAAYPPTPGSEYYAGIGSAGEIVNFHNIQDDALDGWTKGQDLKPNNGAGPVVQGVQVHISPDEGYDYDPIIIPVRLFYHEGPPRRDMLFPDQTYEIFAHSAEARCYAIGAREINAFPSVNLNSGFSEPDYNFTDTAEDHSAQFRATNMSRHEFWNELLDQFALLPEVFE